MKIGIVGGGVSGITCAYQLRKKGYKEVTLFEKNEHVGGNVFTSWVYGEPFEHAALFITATNRLLMQIIRENKIEYRLRKFPDDWCNFVKMKDNIKLLSWKEIISDFYSYMHWHPSAVKVLSDRSQAELLSVFMNKQGTFMTTVVRPLLEGFIGPSAYNDISTTFLHKLISPLYLLPLISMKAGFDPKLVHYFDDGYLPIWEQIAKHSGAKVVLNGEVKKVTPDDSGVNLITAKGEYQFDRVIMATPLDTSQRLLNLSLVDQTQMKFVEFHSFIVETHDVVESQIGHCDASKNFGVFWYGNYRPSKPNIFVVLLEKKPESEPLSYEEKMSRFFENLKTSISTVHHHKAFSCSFVNTLGERAGIFAQMNRQQGKRGIYFVHENLTDCFLVEVCMRAAADIIDHNF